MIKMVALRYYLYLHDTHEVARNKVPYNNENDKSAGNCGTPKRCNYKSER